MKTYNTIAKILVPLGIIIVPSLIFFLLNKKKIRRQIQNSTETTKEYSELTDLEDDKSITPTFLYENDPSIEKTKVQGEKTITFETTEDSNIILAVFDQQLSQHKLKNDMEELELLTPIEIGSYLRKVRRNRRQTQEQFSQSLNWSRSTMSRVEKGEKKISHRDFFKILKDLKVDYKVEVSLNESAE